MASDHNRSLFQANDPWGNYYTITPQDPLLDMPSRISTTTLHEWQKATAFPACVLQFQDQNGKLNWITRNKDKGADTVITEFSIQGGSEFPRLMIRLKLTTGTGQAPVHMHVIFPAFSGENIDVEKMGVPVVAGRRLRLAPADATKVFTFSTSLEYFTYREIKLEDHPEDGFKMKSGLTDNGKHLIISWKSSVRPICINFDADTTRLTARQRAAANEFRKLRQQENAVRVIIIPQSNKVPAMLAYFINMPTPTPPPFPRYDARQNPQSLQVVPLQISNITRLYEGSSTERCISDAGLHFVERVDGWHNQPPNKIFELIKTDSKTGRPLIKPIPVRGRGGRDVNLRADQEGQLQGYFLNEREYEVVRLVGLAREIQHVEFSDALVFNRDYDFDLVPTGLMTPQHNTGTHDFYIFLNVRPTITYGDQAAIPPAPGVRVTIKVKDSRRFAAISAAKVFPRMAINSSGNVGTITGRNFSQLPLRITGSTSGQHMSGHQRVTSVGSALSGVSGSSYGNRLSGQFDRLSMGEQDLPDPVETERTYLGVVVPRSGSIHDEFDIAIYLSIEDTGVGMGLQGCRGSFSFGSIVPPTLQVEKAVHFAMHGEESFYNIPAQNWLKRLLLAHDNLSEGRKVYGVDHPSPILPSVPQLNDKQSQAFKQAISDQQRNNLRSCITLIEGPPGTGKTLVATAIAYHSYLSNEKLMMSAGSNYAINNMADSVFQALFGNRPESLTWTDKNKIQHQTRITHQAPQGIWGVYRLEKETDEHFMNFVKNAEPGRADLLSDRDELDTSAMPSGYEHTVNPDHVTEAEYRKVEAYVKFRSTTARRLSLGDHILSRIEKAQQEKSRWTNDWHGAEVEYQKIWWFISLRIWLSNLGFHFADLVGASEAERSDLETEMSDTAKSLSNQSVTAWRDLQTHYLTHAKIVLATAATAGRKSLRLFRAARVLVDEACQLTETDVLNAIVRHQSKLRKVILIGDPKQLQPVVVSLNANEYYEEHGRSLFVRMGLTGIPAIRLNEQRRMDPVIAHFSSNNFYDGEISDHPSTANRTATIRFKRFIVNLFTSRNVKGVGSSSIYFISVDNSTVYHRKNHTSLMNPQYMQWMINIFEPMYSELKGVHADGKPYTFAIMGYYAEEVALLKQLMYRVKGFSEQDVAVINVDASQGREYDYVLLSTCRPGGSIGLGFVANTKRMNVALTRAKNGLIVFGQDRMGIVPQNRAGSMYSTSTNAWAAWQNLVTYCQKQRACLKFRADATNVSTLLRLNLERDWEVFGSGEHAFFS